jgi:predicted nuclease of predicted toxin-antitoxin system
VRLLIDECCEAALASALRADGYDVLEIAVAMRGSGDVNVLQRAISDRRILITNDRGFGQMVVPEEVSDSVGIMVVRVPEWEPSKRIRSVREVLSRLGAAGLMGRLVIVDRDKSRLRGLRRK